MAREENLYINEFIEYYLKLGVDHIFIYDDNQNNTEKIIDAVYKKFIINVTVYEAKKFNIENQSFAFTECYKNNYNKFDWFLMLDIDEFLFIVNNTLKGYLTNKRFNKCDFIKINWVYATDNDLIYYDPRPVFERFKPPYIKSEFVKSIVRGDLSKTIFYPNKSSHVPDANVISCNSIGTIMTKYNPFNVRPHEYRYGALKHFATKSAEEFVGKIKKGTNRNLYQEPVGRLRVYFRINKFTEEKLKFFEENLNRSFSPILLKIKKNLR
jgi:hypothetical protein